MIKRIWNEFSFHTVFMKLVVCFISPRQRLGDIKTHNSFHKYRMKWKSISDPIYNGAPLVAFYDTLGIRRTYSRLKHRRPHGGISLFEHYFNCQIQFSCLSDRGIRGFTSAWKTLSFTSSLWTPRVFTNTIHRRGVPTVTSVHGRLPV